MGLHPLITVTFITLKVDTGPFISMVSIIPGDHILEIHSDLYKHHLIHLHRQCNLRYCYPDSTKQYMNRKDHRHHYLAQRPR